MPFVQRVVSPIYISRKGHPPTQSNQKKQLKAAQQQRATCSSTSSTAAAGAATTTNSTPPPHLPALCGVQESTNITTTTTTASNNNNNNNNSNGSGGSEVSLVARSHPSSGGGLRHDECEFDTVTNITLSNALRQLASLVLIANDIFNDLHTELRQVNQRSGNLNARLKTINAKLDTFDPKLVTVPESDLATFVQIKNHFASQRHIATSLFTSSTRPDNVRNLYEAAAKTPIEAIHAIDRVVHHHPDGEWTRSHIDAFLQCTPVLGQSRKKWRAKIDVEIDTRMPAAIDDLRKWTSTEAIGDITVTPDCVARIGFSNNNSTLVNSTAAAASPSSPSSIRRFEDVTDCASGDEANQEDMPLDHRLPSPEEQCQMIALKFPAELVRVDISGRRFERMCHSRKSLLHVQVSIDIGEHNNLNDDVQTIKRRARSRKPRGKRRNTIAGIDQREIEEAAINGELDPSTSSSTTTTATVTPQHQPHSPTVHEIIDDPIKIRPIVPRSKSSDLLRRDSHLSEHTKSRFNSLKQWGISRLKMMNRFNDNNGNIIASIGSSGGSGSTTKDNGRGKETISDIDAFNTDEIIRQSQRKRGDTKKQQTLSHERKPSYSSSETMMFHPHSMQKAGSPQHIPASINSVKLRESSATRRQRRAINNLCKEEPNSSSGNWSASSESGRTSIGSEITAQPKSSASSSSLNPPSSIISRRRFLNTSASSSVTSEGTVTPELQVHEFFTGDDGDASSAYSCDTEGYYTSFHVDSGLKTLKEEEPVTPLHSSSALSSTNSFGSSSNQTVVNAESEYELFGRGSTSTTTSSAGTVCTTLMLADRPAVPERKSSLTKLNESNGNLERSYSSSTVGSTLERSGTIKRNGVLLQKEVAAVIHQEREKQSIESKDRMDSPDSGNNTSSSPVETNSSGSPQHISESGTTFNGRSQSEFEYSESSDFEGVERVERIRVKTTINSSRIPSMCVITPNQSEDEDDGTRKGIQETDLDTISFIEHPIDVLPPPRQPELKKEVHHFKKSPLLPLNSVFGRLKGVLPHLKKSPHREEMPPPNEPIYQKADDGEYVAIADARNNNKQSSGIYYSNDVIKRNLATVLSGNLLNRETEYVSLNELPCSIRCDSNSTAPMVVGLDDGNAVAATLNGKAGGGKINVKDASTSAADAGAYDVDSCVGGSGASATICNEGGGGAVKGARVQLDANGKVVYNSDSLRRRRGAHTTFQPGPCVKEPDYITTPIPDLNQLTPQLKALTPLANRKLSVVRPVQKQLRRPDPIYQTIDCDSATTPTTVVDKTSIVVPTKSVMPLKPLINNNQNYNTISSYTRSNGGVATATPSYTLTTTLPKSSSNLTSHMRNMDTPPSTYQGYLQPQQPQTTSSPISEQTTEPYQRAAFQRNNQVYWTLQTRKQPTNPIRPITNDDNQVRRQNIPRKSIEDLYSTPNKIKNPELRTTPLGFSTFFSPVPGAVAPTRAETSVLSPIDPRVTTGGFKTSTPSKMDEELRSRLHIQEMRSLGNSPASSGRSTPRSGVSLPTGSTLETCSDRLGTPKTSLMDFKRLLLATAGKSTVITKPSAVEQLKLARAAAGSPPTVVTPTKPTRLEPAQKKQPITPTAIIQTQKKGGSGINILDLSGSPKTFANRRMLRQGNFGSPSKQMTPRTAGRFTGSLHTHDVITTAIPEANSEDDQGSPLNGGSSPNPQCGVGGGAHRHNAVVIEETVKIKDNIFVQAEENNFMKGELLAKVSGHLLSRTQLNQQAKQQFLTAAAGNVPNDNVAAISSATGQFSNGKRGDKQCDTNISSLTAPSLETSL